ncbi:MAG TPA: hypothetical protein VF311_12555 [Terriglobales bacterium]|jgi:hypothetical protein
MNTPETEELPTPTQAAPAAAEGAKPKARIKAPDAPQKPHVAPVKAKPTSLAEAAKKAPRVSRNAARTGSKNPVSAREIRKTARILGLLKRPGGATVTLHLAQTM